MYMYVHVYNIVKVFNMYKYHAQKSLMCMINFDMYHRPVYNTGLGINFKDAFECLTLI